MYHINCFLVRFRPFISHKNNKKYLTILLSKQKEFNYLSTPVIWKQSLSTSFDEEFDRDFESVVNINKFSTVRKRDPSEKNDRRLFVDNLPPYITWSYLKSLMSTVGSVSRVHLLCNIHGLSTGSATVEFTNAESVKKAIELFDDKKVGDKYIKLRPGIISPKIGSSNRINNTDRNTNFPPDQRYELIDKNNLDSRTACIFFSGVPFTTTELEAVNLFSRIGKVVKCKLFHDNTGQSKGCGIVEFYDRNDAEKAVATLDKSVYNKRKICIRYDHNTLDKNVEK